VKVKGGETANLSSAESVRSRHLRLPVARLTHELSIGDLRQTWAEAWGAPPPKGARRRLLRLGIVWQWQAAVHGGLSNA
jgi:hypothetical protein